MDAATRAELDRLRVRAYGPAADIAGDPRALRRLIDLEAQWLEDRGGGGDEASAVPPPPEPAAGPEPPPRAAAPAVAPVVVAAPAPAPATVPVRAPAVRPALSRRAAIALAAISGAVILTVGGMTLVRMLEPPEPAVTARILAPAVRDARTAYSFAWDRDAVPLLQIPLDGSFGRYIDLPSATEVPEFPATGTVEWAYPLGKYFGWDLWIAGASVDGTGLQREHCIVVERGDGVRGRCVPAALRAQSALLVSVPFASIAPEDRPIGMAPDERLGFWWNHDRAVTVMLGDDP
jgi:hypothetical protein